MDALRTNVAPSSSWSKTRAFADIVPAVDAIEGARFLRILAESRRVRRHYELQAWLKEARAFLPHEILIAAWGDFQRWNVTAEVVSHLPGARGPRPRSCTLDDLLRDAYAQWLRGGREPLVMSSATGSLLRKPCGCALHAALRDMRSALVHGVRDKRSGCDSLYLALDSASYAAAVVDSRFVALAHVLLCQIDSVWRRLAAFRLDDLPASDLIALPRGLGLSAREREILASLARGSTNNDIAESLAISLFTVKNHLKRIFRKIGVSNRTQAAARFNQALMQTADNPGQ